MDVVQASWRPAHTARVQALLRQDEEERDQQFLEEGGAGRA